MTFCIQSSFLRKSDLKIYQISAILPFVLVSVDNDRIYFLYGFYNSLKSHCELQHDTCNRICHVACIEMLQRTIFQLSVISKINSIQLYKSDFFSRNDATSKRKVF